MLKFIREKLNSKKRIAAFGITVLLIVVIGGRWIYLRTRPIEYQTFETQKQDITQSVEVSGEIEAEEEVDLHFQALGRLAWIGVKEGDTVNKWQAVASQDKRTLEKQLKQDLIAFEKEYRDYQQSVDDNPLVNHRFKRILEKAQFDLDSEVIDVEIKNLAIELATLVSPISGIVTQVDTPVAGVNVIATDTISIVNPETLYFEVEVDESDISRFRMGQKAMITLDAYEDETIEGEIFYIDFESSVSEGGGTVFLVKITLLPTNEALKYRLGMTGDTEVILEEKQDVLVVPVESIIERNGKSLVDILTSSGKTEKREVNIGLESEDFVEIVSGLETNEKVIIPQ